MSEVTRAAALPGGGAAAPPSRSAEASGAPATPAARGLRFHKPRLFWFKTALLAVATIALIPILLLKHELAATIYLVFLAVVHVVGLVIFAIGVTREDIAPSMRGFWTRMAGLAFAVVLLYLVSKGLQDQTVGLVFWGSLFSIWALHTLALTMLHVRGRGEAACPFA